jgi:hypothetical protein
MVNASLMMRRLKRRCGSGWDNSQNTCMLRVLTHWWDYETGVSVLVDMSRTKCCFPGSILTCLCLISICDLFTFWLTKQTITASVGCYREAACFLFWYWSISKIETVHSSGTSANLHPITSSHRRI